MNKTVESTGNGGKIYKSVFVKPQNLSALANDLAMKIINSLSKNQAAVTDIARELKESEQKIYYHMKKLENAGMVKGVREELRYGLTTKIYGISSPVVSAKLHDSAEEVNVVHKNSTATFFLKPFIENDMLDAKIIIGDPRPHGNQNQGAYDGIYANDLALFLGSMAAYVPLPCYKFDTEVTEEDLKGNIIVIGSPKVNTVAGKINSNIPLYFDEGDDFSIVSKKSSMRYNEDSVGVIVKAPNPFNPEKKLLLLAGRRSSGTIAAIYGITRYLEKVIGSLGTNTIARVVKNSDGGYPENIHLLE